MNLEQHFEPGFGISPSVAPGENFTHQVWARDFALASINYFAEEHPEAVIDSLATLFRYQREDGMLPLRVERQYALLKIIPLFGWLAKPLLRLIRKAADRPVYEGQDFSGAEDTVPAVVIAAGELFLSSDNGKAFVRAHFSQLQKAIAYFRTKTDARDGLAVVTRINPDWADSIQRHGKLGTINVLWAKSLRVMEHLARSLSHDREAKVYAAEAAMVEHSVREKLFSPGGYFRAVAGEERIDAVATIFGALTLLNAKECVGVLETLERRLKHASGLKNFDPPYPASSVFWISRLSGHAGYHNEYVWPWVTCENIQLKMKVALHHPDAAVRERYKHEAMDDLADTARLFKKLGGAYEIVQPDEPAPAASLLYTPPKNFMASLAGYLGAYHRMMQLQWLA